MREIIGQTKLLSEVKFLLEDIKKGNHHNVFLIAPSGYGKTTLALTILLELGGLDNCYFGICSDNKLLAPFDYNKPYIFLDEVHSLKEPEWLYPLLDAGNKSYFLLTNELGLVKEPLRNRCLAFVFEQYSLEDLAEIAEQKLLVKLPDKSLYLRIAELGKGNPRIVTKLCERLSYIFSSILVPKDLLQLNAILRIILNISDDNLDPMERRYLEFLNRVGGKASLSVISAGTGFTKTTLLTEVEPKLLYEGRIIITSRGRQINDSVYSSVRNST